jgi:hypothetical protein
MIAEAFSFNFNNHSNLLLVDRSLSSSVQIVKRSIFDDVLDRLENNQERSCHHKQKQFRVAVHDQNTVHARIQLLFYVVILEQLIDHSVLLLESQLLLPELVLFIKQQHAELLNVLVNVIVNRES